MSECRSLGVIFIISMIICIFSTVAFFLSTNTIYLENVNHIIFITLILSYSVSIFSIYKIFSSKKNEKNEIKEKEKNVKDFYQYKQLLNPPEIDN